jgi:hypothetical protein
MSNAQHIYDEFIYVITKNFILNDYSNTSDIDWLTQAKNTCNQIQRNMSADITTLDYITNYLDNKGLEIDEFSLQPIYYYIIIMCNYYADKEKSICIQAAETCIKCLQATESDANDTDFVDMLKTTTIKCVSSDDLSLRNDWLKLWEQFWTVITSAISPLLELDIVTEWKQLEVGLAIIAMLRSYCEDTDSYRTTINRICTIIQETKEPKLFATAVLALSHITCESSIDLSFILQAYNTVLPFVQSKETLVQISAVEAIAVITEQIMLYRNGDEETPTNTLSDILQTVITNVRILLETTFDPIICKYYCERTLAFPSDMMAGEAKIRYLDQFNLLLSSIWTVSVISRVKDITTLEQRRKIADLIYNMFKLAQGHKVLNHVLCTASEFMIQFENDELARISEESFEMAIAVVNKATDSATDFVIEVANDYTEGDVFPYRFILSASLEKLSIETLNKIYFSQGRKILFLDILKKNINVKALGSDVIFGLAHVILLRGIIGMVFDSHEEGIIYVAENIIPKAIELMTLPPQEPFFPKSLISFQLASSQCVASSFLHECSLDISIKVKDNFTELMKFILDYISYYQGNIFHLLTLANFAHILSMMLTVYGDMVTNDFWSIGVYMITAVVNEELSQSDNIDILSAFCDMVEQCTERKILHSNIPYVLDMIYTEGPFLMSKYPMLAPNIKRAIMMCQVLQMMYDTENDDDD